MKQWFSKTLLEVGGPQGADDVLILVLFLDPFEV